LSPAAGEVVGVVAGESDEPDLAVVVDVVPDVPDGFVVLVVEDGDFVPGEVVVVLAVRALAVVLVALEAPEDFGLVVDVVVPEDFAVVVVFEDALGFAVVVVLLSEALTAPGFRVVVVVGLAFLGRGTVQVRREEPS
jgi:hypothetical protein